MKNGYSPIVNDSLIAFPIDGSSATQHSLYMTACDSTVETICVKPLDDICVSFKGKEYAVDWIKFIRDYCTEM